MPEPSPKASCTRKITGTHTEVAFGANPVMTSSTGSASDVTAVSTAAVVVADRVKISRGQLILFISVTLAKGAWAPVINDAEKNVQGIRPTYENSTYGTPCVSTRVTLLKKNVKTST